MKTFITV